MSSRPRISSGAAATSATRPGTILIVAQGHGVPADGARVRVKGKLEPTFGLNGSTVVAILQTNP